MNDQNTKFKTVRFRRKDFEIFKRYKVFVQKLPKTISNIEDGKQVIRSSGSIGANYIEANEALSKKDFIMRIMICRKEAKETGYWLELLDVPEELESERKRLLQEATELRKIFGAILEKSK
ncbi:MAG: four helix bundle protein [Candidatus Levybacteria bacterium RIFCSPLOWO2_02_FULL_37_18]|nr:MAG: four helix bundle protein [Candidatus Levybacteria bacterium RIFCSPLOWO2_02_FULL_37_18]